MICSLYSELVSADRVKYDPLLVVWNILLLGEGRVTDEVIVKIFVQDDQVYDARETLHQVQSRSENSYPS